MNRPVTTHVGPLGSTFKELRVEFLTLSPGNAPRKLDASKVLGGLTPDDVCEAVDGVRDGETRNDRTKAVERIVQRRQDGSVRVREEAAVVSQKIPPRRIRMQASTTTAHITKRFTRLLGAIQYK